MIILKIVAVVRARIPVVLVVLSADVLPMNPMMSEVRHVPRDPNHFIAAVPIVRAMVVIWPVAKLDGDALCSHSNWSENARCNNGDEQKFVFNHSLTDHVSSISANTV